MSDQQWEHFGPDGKKTGESEQKKSLFGDEFTEHRDAAGAKTGKSETKKTFFGDVVTEHRDSAGRVIGKSEEKTTFFGDKYVEEKDKNGKVIGTAVVKKDLFGEERVEQRDMTGKVTGTSFFKNKSTNFWLVIAVVAVLLILVIIALVPVLLGAYIIRKGWGKCPDSLRWIFIGSCYLFGVGEYHLFSSMNQDYALIPIVLYTVLGIAGTLFQVVSKTRQPDIDAAIRKKGVILSSVAGFVLLALSVASFLLLMPKTITSSEEVSNPIRNDTPVQSQELTTEPAVNQTSAEPSGAMTEPATTSAPAEQQEIPALYLDVLNRYFEKQQSIPDAGEYISRQNLLGDLNRDGTPDMVSFYTVEGMGGGNWFYTAIALFMMEDSGLTYKSELPAGAKLSVYMLNPVSIENGLVRIDRECNDFYYADSCSKDSLGPLYFAVRKGYLRQTTLEFYQYSTFADSLRDNGDSVGAYTAYKTALEKAAITSDSVSCLASLSQTAFERHEYLEARQYCEALIVAAPKSKWAKDLLVRINESEANQIR